MFSMVYDFTFLGWLIVGVFVGIAGIVLFFFGTAVWGARKIVEEDDERHVEQPAIQQPPIEQPPVGPAAGQRESAAPHATSSTTKPA